MVFGQPCTIVEVLADAILLASVVPRRACLLATRAPRDNDNEAVLAVLREVPSRGGVGAVTAGVAVQGEQRSFVADAGAPRPFREIGDDDVAIVAGNLLVVVVVVVGGGGGVDEQNDFWRNTPGEHDGNTSGEILLRKKTRD